MREGPGITAPAHVPTPDEAFFRYGPAGLDHLLGDGAAASVSGGVDPVQTGSIRAAAFGSMAIPMRNFPALRRWTPLMDRIDGCASGSACASEPDWFRALGAATSRMRFKHKLDLVNREVNRNIRYVSDRESYGDLDHWASPDEILARSEGDCEDFAILKMAALIRAGVPAGSMSLVVLRDQKFEVYHAVLTVKTSQGIFVLDNLRDRVLPDTALTSYQPLFSLSKDRAWIHGVKAGAESVASSNVDPLAIAPGEGYARSRQAR